MGVVAEGMGGATLAYEYDRRCLEAGKNVVTSNKELVAEKGLGLTALALTGGVLWAVWVSWEKLWNMMHTLLP